MVCRYESNIGEPATFQATVLPLTETSRTLPPDTVAIVNLGDRPNYCPVEVMSKDLER